MVNHALMLSREGRGRQEWLVCATIWYKYGMSPVYPRPPQLDGHTSRDLDFQRCNALPCIGPPRRSAYPRDRPTRKRHRLSTSEPSGSTLRYDLALGRVEMATVERRMLPECILRALTRLLRRLQGRDASLRWRMDVIDM